MPALMSEWNFALALLIGSAATDDTRRVHGDPGIPPEGFSASGDRRPGDDSDAVPDHLVA